MAEMPEGQTSLYLKPSLCAFGQKAVAPLLAFRGLTYSLRRGTVPRQGRTFGSVGLSQGCGSPVEWAGQPALLGSSWVLGGLGLPKEV